MMNSSHRFAATAVLLVVVCGVGGWWFWQKGPVLGRMTQGLAERPANAPTAAQLEAERASYFAASTEPAHAQPGTKESRTQGKPQAVQDRFAAAAILEERTTERVEAGVPKSSRIRLIRQEDFKYPLLRVVDEFEGTRLVRQTAMVADHVLVKLREGVSNEAQFLKDLAQVGGSVRRKMPASGNWLIAFNHPTADTVPKAISHLTTLQDWVQIAEPDYIVHALAMPNDSGFANLWGLHNTGQSGGVPDSDVDAPEAWNLNTGSRDVVVAVIDSGIDLTHPDLAPNLWTNAGEIAGNGIDDDGNGYVDDTRGWDFVSNDPVPGDDNSHGTHCAGTIGAVGNNGAGVAGVCWQVSLVALKFLNASGNGSLSDGIEAIAYATELNVALTSNSWGGGGYSAAMKEAIDEADAAGILFIAASGNSGSNIEYFPGYPASYTSPNIVSVAALTRTESLPSYSNFGATATDLGAPGSEIYSTMPGGGYGWKTGTSMAAPHVAGACALLMSYRPGLGHAQVRDVILRSVDAAPALVGRTATGGRLNLFNALIAADDILVSPGTDLAAAGMMSGEISPNHKVYTLTNHGASAANWTAAADKSWITLSSTHGTLPAGGSAEVQVSLNTLTDTLPAGDHAGTITFASGLTGRTQLRQARLRILPPPLYSYNLDTDPGWSRSGQWAFGAPAGGGATFFGRPDPSGGYTGATVFGINLDGDYSTTPAAPQYLVAGPFDLSSHHGTSLRYRRWLNSDHQPWVHATVEVSFDYVTWHRVWDNGSSPYAESDWAEAVHDLSSHADGRAQVYVRWGHHIRDTGAYQLSGWNIDDIEILAVPDRQIRLTVPEDLVEGEAAEEARVVVTPAPTADLVINLYSDRNGAEAEVPIIVVVPTGQQEVVFPINALDDALVDGTQQVIITAAAADFPPHAATLMVHDNEQGQLALSLPATLIEGTGTGGSFGQVTLAAPAEANLTIRLVSLDISEIEVPESLAIPQGETQASFPLTVVDDIYIDGTQTATVKAEVVNWPPATASIQMQDNEPRVLTVTLPERRKENAGIMAAGGTVTVNAPVELPLVVNLISDDVTELTVPQQVVVQARATSATFDLLFADDDIEDGTQTVMVTATAPGFQPKSAFAQVEDDEIPAMAIAPSPTHGATMVHPDVDFSWSYDEAGGSPPESYDLYLGTAPELGADQYIGSTTGTTRTLPRLTPGTTYYWQVMSKRGAVVTAGTVWSFTVAPIGPVSRFGWEPLPTTVAVGAPVGARVTAYDAYDNVVDSFSGSAAISTAGGGPETITGTGVLEWEFPMATYFHDARTQSIYLPAEVGPAGQLTSMALDVVTKPGKAMNEFTIRLKHTSKSAYGGPGSFNAWDSTGWTTVFSGPVNVTATGWRWFVFSTPFEYDGTSKLMVDISFNNTSPPSTYGYCRATPTSDYRSLAQLNDSNISSTNPNLHPKDWTGTLPLGQASLYLPNLRFRRAESVVPIFPSLTGTFEHGSWYGDVTLLAAGEAIRLHAQSVTDPLITGSSGLINAIIVPTPALNAEPLFTGGNANTLSWTVGAGSQVEVHRSGDSTFANSVSSGVLGGSSHTFANLTDGETYHYRARVVSGEVLGPWSAPVRSTQDATPPQISFSPGSGGVVVAGQLLLRGAAADATSGVADLTVGNMAVAQGAGNEGFSAWEYAVADLQDGENTFTVTAHDHAEPPNFTSASWTVTRISNVLADADRNGVGALLEYAFNVSGAQAHALLPRVVTEVDPGSQERSLILTYRRRLAASSLDYRVEMSQDLRDWQPTEAIETVSVNPSGDGVTENVVLRVRPGAGQSESFVRVRVLVP